MASPKELLLEAQQLIKARDYLAARRLLLTIDHPKAREWLDKLDEIAPESPPAPAKSTPRPRQQPTVRPSSSPVIVEEKSRIPLLGAIMLILATVVGGFAVGGLLYFSSLYLYLICFSVAIAGAIGGGLLWLVVRVTKVRDSFIVGAMALALGLLSYGTYRYLEYNAFRTEVRQVIYEEEPNADPVLVENYIDEVLVEETGQSGLLGFLAIQAEEGLSMNFRSRYSSSSSSGIPISLSPPLTVVYWIVEILIISLVGMGTAAGAVNHPFCEETNNWLKFEKLSGRIPSESIEAFAEALSREDYGTAASLLENRRMMSQPFLTIEVGRCHDKSPEARLKITRQSGRNSDVIIDGMISAADYHALRHGHI